MKTATLRLALMVASMSRRINALRPLIIPVKGGTITINQPSTGDVNVGTIAADGSFLVESQFESYGGADGSGTAVNTDGSGCIVAYQVVFTPQG